MRRSESTRAMAVVTWAAMVWSVTFSFANLCGAADELRPSWTCLPQGAVALGRIPQGQAFVKALRGETRLGALLFDPARIGRMSQAFTKIAAEDNGEWENLKEKLASYNLKASDWAELFSSEVGFAVILHTGKEHLPLPVGLTWIEPSGDLSTRLMAALDKAIEAQKDDKDPIRRVDFELAGQQVIHLTIPWTDSVADEETTDGDKATEQEKKKEESAEQLVDYSHLLLAKLGNRLLMANTFGVYFSIPSGGADESPAKPDATLGIEETKQVFAQFLAAHAEKGDNANIRLLEAPGLLASLPGGVPAFELILDPRPLVKLLDSPENEQAFRMLKALAIDQLGPIAYRLTLEKNVLRGGLFVSASAPRAGLLGLMDQPASEAQPPAWVPADVVQYSQINFDLGAAYARIKDLVIAELGDEVRPKWGQLESQFSQFMKTDIATLLSSLGNRHVSLSLPPTKAAEAPGADDAAALLGFYDRSATVWQLKDENLWKRMLQMLAALTGLELVEEQGFQGIRYEHESLEIGAFLGRGHLVVGIGKDVSEGLLANLRNPPAGAASLAGSNIMQKASELLRSEPAIHFSVTDTNRQIKSLRSLLATALQTADVADGEKEDELDKEFRELFEALLPSEQELEGVFGVGASQATVTEHGLVGRGALKIAGSLTRDTSEFEQVVAE